MGAADLDASFKVEPSGRLLKKVPHETLAARARRLAAVLLSDPVVAAYPVPFVLDEVSSGKR